MRQKITKMENSLLAILTNILYNYGATLKIHKKSIKLSTMLKSCVNLFLWCVNFCAHLKSTKFKQLQCHFSVYINHARN